MKDSELLQQISSKNSNKEEIAMRIVGQPELLYDIFEGLNSSKASIKFGCDKILRLISEKEPNILYPKIDFFIDQLDIENSFLKWGAIRILSNLAVIDSKNKIEAFLKKHNKEILAYSALS